MSKCTDNPEYDNVDNGLQNTWKQSTYIEPKQETLEEFIEREGYPDGTTQEIWEDGVRIGVDWQSKKMYSKEDIIDFVYFINDRHFNKYTVDTDEVDLFIEQFKKK